MASSQEINDVVDQLSKASVGDKIIDFSGQGLKLDAANDGVFFSQKNLYKYN